MPEDSDAAFRPQDEYETLLVEWLNQQPYAVATIADRARQEELARLRAAKEAAWLKRRLLQQSAEA